MAPLTTEMTISRNYSLKEDERGELINLWAEVLTDNPALFPANFSQGVLQARTGLHSCLQVQTPSPLSCSFPESFSISGDLWPVVQIYWKTADESKSYRGKIHPHRVTPKTCFHGKPGGHD